jgi:hypothetical protein
MFPLGVTLKHVEHVQLSLEMVPVSQVVVTLNGVVHLITHVIVFGVVGRVFRIDKTDVTDLNDNLGINLIRKLKPVEYRNDNRKSYVDSCGFDFGVKDGTLKVNKKHYGFIAQEVKESADELNIDYEAVKYNTMDDTFKLNYSDIIASIVKTIKTIDERVQILKTKI